MGIASELVAWLRSLDPTFAFLPAVPFAVACTFERNPPTGR